MRVESATFNESEVCAPVKPATVAVFVLVVIYYDDFLYSFEYKKKMR